MKPPRNSAPSTTPGLPGRCLLLLLLLFTLPVGTAQAAADTLLLPPRVLAAEAEDELTTRVDLLWGDIAERYDFSMAPRSLTNRLLAEYDNWPPPASVLRQLELPEQPRFLVLGSLTRLGTGFSIDTTVYDRAGEQPPRHFNTEADHEERLTPALERLTTDLLNYTEPAGQISAIHVEGNDKTGAGAIRRQISSQVGDRLDDQRLRDDIKTIFELGYFDDVQVEAEEEDDGTSLTFVVTEKPVISQVLISGNRQLEEEEIREHVAVVPNTILNPGLVRQAAANITQFYKDKGYHEAVVEQEIVETEQGKVNVRFEIEEGQRIYIEEIAFTGNETFSARQLRREIDTQSKGFFSWLTSSGRLQPEILEQDRARLAAFYNNHGFIDVRIGEPEIEQEDDRLRIVFNIEEGPRFRVGAIELGGDLLFPKEELRALIELQDEEYFNRQVLREDVNRLSDRYAQEGYAFVEVVPQSSRDDEDRRININFVIDKDVLVHINRIVIRGNTRTRDNVIRRQVEVKEGEIFDTTALRESMQNLQRLDFFEDIDIRPEPALMRDDLMDVNIEVTEKPTGTFSIGAGYSSMDQIMVMGQISQENFMGRGQRLAFQADISSRAAHYNLGFTEPHLDDSELLFGFDLYNWEREYIDYTRKSTGGALRFGYPLGDDWRLKWGYGYEKTTLSDISDNASFWITQSLDIETSSYVRLGVTRDTRDDRLDPTRGAYHDLEVKHAGGPLGGDAAYTRFEGSTTWFFPWERIPALKESRSDWLHSTTFRLKGAMGYVMENESDSLPIYEKFFLGGLRSMRGFEVAGISPRDPDTGERIGGEKMWYMNSEWIFPISQDIGLKGLVFYDTGNVYRDSDNWSFDDLRQSVGFGFRWLSPMGPLRLEWGYNLDPKDDEDQAVWDFSMGGIF
ncbi:MAG: outer membrane protein assembly factor BamA [Desulfurivibrio sp.]|nr:outer membrane protein assembly factor BamA [Desulfurivibrio sp.]